MIDNSIAARGFKPQENALMKSNRKLVFITIGVGIMFLLIAYLGYAQAIPIIDTINRANRDLVEAEKIGTTAAYEEFLKYWADTPVVTFWYGSKARDRIDDLSFERAGKFNSLTEYNNFMRKFPNSRNRQAVVGKIAELTKNNPIKSGSWMADVPSYSLRIMVIPGLTDKSITELTGVISGTAIIKKPATTVYMQMQFPVMKIITYNKSNRTTDESKYYYRYTSESNESDGKIVIEDFGDITYRRAIGTTEYVMHAESYAQRPAIDLMKYSGAFSLDSVRAEESRR